MTAYANINAPPDVGRPSRGPLLAHPAAVRLGLRRKAVSLDRVEPVYSHLLDVEGGLEPAEHGVVDALFVAQAEHRRSLVVDGGEPERSVLLNVLQGGVVVGLACVGADEHVVLFESIEYPSHQYRTRNWRAYPSSTSWAWASLARLILVMCSSAQVRSPASAVSRDSPSSVSR